MEKNIFKISCATYFVSLLAMMFFAFNPNMDVAPEILSYMQWWYSQPNTVLEGMISKLGFIAFVVSLIGVVALYFCKKWGGYLFLPPILFVVASEWLAPGYYPKPSLDANIDTIASISAGFIICALVFSEKLEIFKHNKSFKSTPESGAV